MIDISKRTLLPALLVDVLEASYLSVDWTLAGDAMHYNMAYSKMVLSWFYPPDDDQ